MTRKTFVRKRQSENLRSKTQQKNRRKDGLFRKAYQYCIECDADVYVVLRIRRNGQIYVFNSDSTGEWPPSKEQLNKYYLFQSRRT
ncbi:hypothetical protein VTN96DRAFT_5702 [Rasamsonia emersonii]